MKNQGMALDIAVYFTSEFEMTEIIVDRENIFGAKQNDLIETSILNSVEHISQKQIVSYLRRIRNMKDNSSISLEFGMTVRGKDTPVWFKGSLEKIDNDVFFLGGVAINQYKIMEHYLQSLGREIPLKPQIDFFQDIAKSVAITLDVDYVLVNIPAKENMFKGHPLAYWTPTGFQEPADYDLRITPCQDIIVRKTLIYHPVKLQTFFPDNYYLVDINARSYVGIPALGPNNEVLGWVAVLHSKIIKLTDTVKAYLHIFAFRLGIALARYEQV